VRGAGLAARRGPLQPPLAGTLSDPTGADHRRPERRAFQPEAVDARWNAERSNWRRSPPIGTRGDPTLHVPRRHRTSLREPAAAERSAIQPALIVAGWSAGRSSQTLWTPTGTLSDPTGDDPRRLGPWAIHRRTSGGATGLALPGSARHGGRHRPDSPPRRRGTLSDPSSGDLRELERQAFRPDAAGADRNAERSTWPGSPPVGTLGDPPRNARRTTEHARRSTERGKGLAARDPRNEDGAKPDTSRQDRPVASDRDHPRPPRLAPGGAPIPRPAPSPRAAARAPRGARVRDARRRPPGIAPVRPHRRCRA
jgi:hypothetical protein